MRQGPPCPFCSILPVFEDQPGASPATSRDRAASLHRFRSLFENIRRAFGTREFVIAFDQKPVLVLLARLAVHSDEMPAAMQFLAVKLKSRWPLA